MQFLEFSTSTVYRGTVIPKKSSGVDPPSQNRNLAEPTWLYERVAHQIASLIDQGTLRPGDRIPSVRKLTTQQNISVATALQAYQLLEHRGLIEARPQSGYYVRAWRRLRPSQPRTTQPPTGSRPLNMAALVMEVVGMLSQPGLIQLGAAVPPPEMLPSRELHRALASAARRQPSLANTCDPSAGLLPLRSEIARLTLEAGCSLAPDDIVIMNGTTEALHLCLSC